MFELFSDKEWSELEHAARSAVVAGGFAAMGYYRNALANPDILGKAINPTTEADMQATLAILRSLHPNIKPLLAKKCGYSYLAEEIAKGATPEADKKWEEIQKKLGEITDFLTDQETFIKKGEFAVLFDGLDGTTNFMAGLPLFCSAIAFFIEKQPSVGAIYDPHHNIVYYGSLRGKSPDLLEEEKRCAYIWDVQSGNNVKLPLHSELKKAGLKLIGIHLTRSDNNRRKFIIDKLEKLVSGYYGTYMLNSGQLALAYVASENLSAYINNYTNIWDVAAGEVLVKATGGLVTDFDGRPIDYEKPKFENNKVEVLATTNREIHTSLLNILK